MGPPLTSLVADCGVTPEYGELRTEVYRMARESYEQCRKAVSADRYWRAYTECESENRGEKVGGGCAHVAGITSLPHVDEPDPAAHCEILKPSQADIQAILEEHARERNITKRSSSQPDGCRTPATQPPLN